MAISAEVQKVLDDIAANKSASASIEQGVALLQKQIADLQIQIASATGLSADDKTALGAAATDLESTTAALATAIPANTPAA